MKHMHIRYAALLLFALLSASVSSFAQTVLEQKINAISAIKEIRPLETSEFSEKYVTYLLNRWITAIRRKAAFANALSFLMSASIAPQ